MANSYLLSHIRMLLTEGFTAEELRRFCFDSHEFRPVYDQIWSGSGKAEIIDWLLVHAEQKLLFEPLLAWAKAANPIRYAQHQPYIALSEDVASLQSIPSGKIPDPTASLEPDEFLYDVYISYVDQEPDATWVWEKLVPGLEAAGLRLAVSGETDRPGVPRVVNIEQAIAQARRIIAVLSPAYLTDHFADFQNVLAQTSGLWEGRYRLLPIKIAPFDETYLRGGLRILDMLDLTHSRQVRTWRERLIRELESPLPVRRNV